MKKTIYCSIIIVVFSLVLSACYNETKAARNGNLNRWGDITVAPSKRALNESLSDEPLSVQDEPDFPEDSYDYQMPVTVVEGQTFINFLGMKMIWVDSGKFVMGREESAQRMKVSINGTWPLRTVTVRQGFWIAQTEVTQGQYKQLRGSNPSHFKGNYHPVDSVSWKESVQFCRLLTERQGASEFVYLLPSEAQWEYACRATSTAIFYGPELGPLAWYFPNSKNLTHRVKVKTPNAWGLFDMLGNVDEWCSDHFSHTYHDAPLDESSRQDIGTVRRVVRGGSYDSRYVKEISSSGRRGAGPAYRYSKTGFRPVMVLKRSR